MNPRKFIILVLVIICLRSVKKMYKFLQFSLRLCASWDKATVAIPFLKTLHKLNISLCLFTEAAGF